MPIVLSLRMLRVQSTCLPAPVKAYAVHRSHGKAVKAVALRRSRSLNTGCKAAESDVTREAAASASQASNAPDTEATSAVVASSSKPAIPEEQAFDPWFATNTMLQLWVILLGVGYTGVPLLAQLLSSLHGGGTGQGVAGLDQAGALFLAEAGALLGVRALLQRKLAGTAEGPQWVPRLEYRWDVRSMLMGMGAGTAALAINNATLSLLAQAAEQQQQQPETMGVVASILQEQGGLEAALLFLGSAMLAPAAEEVVYRGFLLPTLQRALPAPAAVGVVALLFAAAHLQPDGIVQLAVVGACLGTAAVVTGGNLAAPTVGHMVYNAALFLGLMTEG